MVISLPCRKLGRVEHDGRLQDRHGAIGHGKRRVVLELAVARIVRAEGNAEHARHGEDFFLAVGLLEVHRQLDGEAPGGIRGRGKLGLRGLCGEGALRGLRGVEQTQRG